MAGIRRVSDLGTKGMQTIVDGSVQTADIANNAITQAKLSTDVPLSGLRNLLINGAMQVAQRGTSTASITADTYGGADRWRLDIDNSLGTWTQSVETDSPTGSGFAKSTKVICTTAQTSPSSTSTLSVQQRIEGQNLQLIKKGTTSAAQLTLSFWVKSNLTGTYIVELQDFDNTRNASLAYTIGASATWEKKTITFPADTIGALDNDNNTSLSLNFWLGAGSNFTSGTLQTTWGATVAANRVVGQVNLAAATNNYWQITGVQLEANTQPTPFEQRPISLELALCQRYYQRMSGPSQSNVGIGYWFGAVGYCSIPISVPLRTTVSSGSFGFSTLFIDKPGTTGSAVTAAGFRGQTAAMLSVDFTTGSSFTNGAVTTVLLNSGTAYFEVSAEL